MALKKVVSDIKSLKIQGAESIAREAVKALKDLVLCSRVKSIPKFEKDVYDARNVLSSARPTEPCLRNCLNYITRKTNGMEVREIKEEYIARAQYVLKHLLEVEQRIAELGSMKIKNQMVVFTHCHSSAVMSVLRAASQKGVKFIVNNTETRPKFQGRLTARELAKVGVEVNHFVDSAARLAIKRADIALIGCDAISIEGKVINKIGSEMFAEIANRFDVPLYVCTDSWKFDPESVYGVEEKIEERNPGEVWGRPPKNVVIHNPAFEKVNTDLISGIISELGVYKPVMFLEELKNNYEWMFK